MFAGKASAPDTVAAVSEGRNFDDRQRPVDDICADNKFSQKNQADTDCLLASLRRASAECRLRIAEERLRAFEFDEIGQLLRVNAIDLPTAINWLRGVGVVLETTEDPA